MKPNLLLITTTLLLTPFSGAQAGEVQINVQADQVLHPVSRFLTGACIEDVNHEIYGGLYSQMIFGESFQEPAPSPLLKGFKSYGGRWIAHDGVLSLNAIDGPKLVADHGAFQDGAVGVDLFFADRKGGSQGLIFHVARPGVGADKFTGYEVSLDAAHQKLRLSRHRDNFAPIKEAPCAVATGRWIPLEVRLTGSVIEVTVEGKPLLHHDDGAGALPKGSVGLRASHCDGKYRRMWVKTPVQTERLEFETTTELPEVSGMWRAVRRGGANGHYALISERPFAGRQSQQMSFDSGDGELGVENQGLNRWGMNFVAGKPYEGCVWVRAGHPVTLFASLESRDGSQTYAETALIVTNGDWKRLAFTLTPRESDRAGRFVLKLKQPGSVTLGYAFLQPGEWGRFKGLPVRRDVAEGMIEQGITVLRYGGSMIGNGGYKWKSMTGPRDRRPPYSGAWYRYSSNGWGIPDFMNFCEAAGFEYIPAFNLGETPQDMADFVRYARDSADSEWGRRRAADGHPAPYRLRFLELGNEERVDKNYADRFEALAGAIWAQAPDLILVVGDSAYSQPIKDPLHVPGAGSQITSLAPHQRILRCAREHNAEVWFDVHVETERPEPVNHSLNGVSFFADALDRLAAGARHKVVVFELNAGNHAQKRALANALAINALERDGRIPIVCSANGLQPDGQNDNKWDQGLLFLTPSQVWLQPPGYVTQMFSRNYEPQFVRCEATPAGNLDANATRSEDGKTLVLQCVNRGDQSVTTRIHLAAFVPARAAAQVIELDGPLDAVNTADKPQNIIPRHSEWSHDFQDGTATFAFQPHSFTILRFE